jgi:hypothetical protein
LFFNFFLKKEKEMSQTTMVLFTEIGQILNSLHGVTPRMMSSDDGELGFSEEDFFGFRGDMFVVKHPKHFASKSLGDFSSANIQSDENEFLREVVDDSDDLLSANFSDDDFSDPEYEKAWDQFISERSDDFYGTITNHKIREKFLTATTVKEKNPIIQRQQEKIKVPYHASRYYRYYDSHGRRGRHRRVPSISEHARHHRKVLNTLQKGVER